MNLQECYEIAGGNAETVMRQFHTEDRIEKYLLKFLSDPSYALLESSLQKGNYEEAFRMAHSLKGMCLILGLQSLQETAGLLTDNLRGKEPDENMHALFRQLKWDYLRTVSAIQLYTMRAQ